MKELKLNLQLSLKKKWFDMTVSDEKKEDYREITPYWCARLLLVNGVKKSKEYWETYGEELTGKFLNMHLKETGLIKTKCLTTNTMTLGYPKKGDPERTRVYQHAGIEIRTGNPDWGAEEGKLYFVIKHGKPI